MSSKNTFRKYVIDVLNKSTFTPSGKVFSKNIALELLSEKLSLRLWRSYDVTYCSFGEKMS